MSLKDLRGLLGNSVRVAIDVSDIGARGVVPHCVVAAHWACGCGAEGTSFSELRSMLCDAHASLAPAA